MTGTPKARKTHVRPAALACPAGDPPGGSKSHLWPGFSAQTAAFDSGAKQETNSFLNEQTANVYENKGSAWKAGGESQNIYQNKGVIHNIRECR
jgi:hypothetical protein